MPMASGVGGLKGDQVKRLKDLEAENTRLQRAVSDLTLETDPEGSRLGKLLSPARRRACVDQVVEKHGVSERFACWILGTLSRKFVDDIQHADLPSIVRPVLDEIVRPAVVGMLRLEPNT